MLPRFSPSYGRSSRSTSLIMFSLTLFLTGCGGGTLVVQAPEGGDVTSADNTINCGSLCEAKYTKTVDVELTANAQSGYQFLNWTEACDGADPVCTVNMKGNKTVGAVFAESNDPGIGSPISVVAGSQITLSYSGSTDPQDELGIYEPEAENKSPMEYVRLPNQSGTVSIRVPRVAGLYELRMVNNKDETIVIDGSLEVTPYNGTITPETNKTTPISKLSIQYSGSTHNTDLVAIYELGAENNRPTKSVRLSDNEGTVELQMPGVEGEFELRMVSNKYDLIKVGTKVTLEYGAAAISAAPIVEPGELVVVEYYGSTDTRDRVAMFGQFGTGYQADKTTGGEQGPINLQMPDKTGIYNLNLINQDKYVIAEGGYVSVLNPLIAEVFAAPGIVAINGDVTLAFSGSESSLNAAASIGIFEQDADNSNYLNQVMLPADSPTGNLQISAPSTDGIYEVRMISSAGESQATNLVYVLDPAKTALHFPANIVAGDTAHAIFSGIPGTSNRIAIYAAGEEDLRKYVASQTINGEGNYADVRVPTTPGAYVVKLISSSYTLLAEGNAFNVTPYDATLNLSTVHTSPSSIITADYTGSTHSGDRLAIYLPGADNRSYLANVTLADNAGSVSLRVPAFEGIYDVRIINSTYGLILDAGQITLSYGQLALSAQSIAYPGESIPVDFEGSTEISDRIVLVAQDSTAIAKSVTTGDLNSGTVNLVVPTATGIYDLRLVNPGNAVIARGGFVSVLDSADTAIFVAAETTHNSEAILIAYSGSESTADARETVGVYEVGSDNSAPLSQVTVPDGSIGTTSLNAPANAGIYEVRLVNSNGETITTAQRLKVINSAISGAYVPNVVAAGETVKALYSGSPNTNDRIAFYVLGEEDPKNYIGSSTANKEEGWVNMRMPTLSGQYEVKLISSQNQVIAQGNSFTVTPYNATLSIASFATPSSKIPFTFSGSTDRADVVGLYVQGGTLNDRVAYKSLVTEAGESEIQMPATEGVFEVKIVNSKKEVILDAGLIQVSYSNTISLSGPAIVSPNDSFTADYEGSTQSLDSIVLNTTNDPITSKTVASTKTNGVPSGSLNLVSPEVTGIYSLEMINPGKALMTSGGFVSVLRSDELSIFAAPARTEPGATVTTAFSGSSLQGNTVGIFEQGSSNSLPVNSSTIGSAEQTGTLTLAAPSNSGIYDVRLLDLANQTRGEPATLYIVNEEETAVHSPNVVKAGETVTIIYSSLDETADKVAYYPVGSTEQSDAGIPSRITKASGAVKIRVPTVAGQYVLRLIDQSYGVIASGDEVTVLPYDGGIDP